MSMHQIAYRTVMALLCFTIILFSGNSSSVCAQKLAVRADIVYTMSGKAINNGVVLIENGRIERVGESLSIPSEYEVHENKVATPGLIDAHSVVGLAGYYNYKHDQDQLEKSDAIQPELRAVDAYNSREKLVEWLRNLGVTTLHTGHGPGALISGQTMIIKTNKVNANDAINPAAMMAMTLGSTVSSNYKTPGTRSKGVAMLRAALIKAQAYAEKTKLEDESKHPDRDLKMEMLAKVLAGEMPVLLTAQRSTEIMSALRLEKEFGFRLILDGAAEAYLHSEEIKSADVPVIVHPTMVRNYGEMKNVSFETAAKLRQAEIPFAFQSGYESYVPKTRVVLFEAAIAAANGLAFGDALAALTIESAKILGVDNRVGSLQKGKDADIVLFDGDPFEYTSHVCTVIIDGVVVSSTCK